MTMSDYIMKQSEIFRGVLEQNIEITAGFEEIFDGEESDHVYLIAGGTLCNVTKAAIPFMEHVLKQEVGIFLPSQMERTFGERPLLIFIFQSRESTSMVAAVEKMKGYPRIAMTGSANGRINSVCEHYIMIPRGDEAVGPRTREYTATALALHLMAPEMVRKTGGMMKGEYREHLAVLETFSVQYQENIRRTRKWMEKDEEGFRALKEVYFASKGQSMLVAQKGALKVMETYLIPGLSYDFEEYLHGPSYSIRKTTGGTYLPPIADGGDYERVQKLVVYHRSICGQVYTVGLPASGDKKGCTLPNSGQWYTKSLEEILPLQIIYAMVPEKLRIDGAGMQHFEEADKFIDVKYKEDVKQAEQMRKDIMECVLGIDNGGTNYRVMTVDLEGKRLGYYVGESANLHYLNEEELPRRITRNMTECLSQFGGYPGGMEYPLYRTTGIDYGEDMERLLRAYRKLEGFPCSMGVINDTELVHYTVTGGRGILIISGTESIVFGINSKRGSSRAGGRSLSIFGDEGPGIWVTKIALKYCARCLDRTVESGPLIRLIESESRIHTGDELIQVSLKGGKSPTDFPQPGRLVNQTAGEGDSYAMDILKGAAQELYKIIVDIVYVLDMEKAEPDFCISIWESNIMKSVTALGEFSKRVKERYPQSRIFLPGKESIDGAVEVALGLVE